MASLTGEGCDLESGLVWNVRKMVSGREGVTSQQYISSQMHPPVTSFILMIDHGQLWRCFDSRKENLSRLIMGTIFVNCPCTFAAQMSS